jgi:hypothetical protein
MGAFPGVLFWAPHVNEGLTQVSQDVFFERSNFSVVALHRGIGRGTRRGDFPREGESLRNPGVTAAIEQSNIVVSKKCEYPQCVGGPPVALVAVNDDGVITRDALPRHQLGEGLSLKVIPHNGIIEFGVPINFDGARDVTSVIEQDVLVRFQDDETFRARVLLQPFRGDESFGVSVVR